MNGHTQPLNELQEFLGKTLEVHKSAQDDGNSTSTQQEASSPDILGNAQLVAVVIADAPHEAIEKLVNIKHQLQSDAALAIIVTSNGGAESQVMRNYDTDWYKSKQVNVAHFRRYLGLSFAMETPEIVIVDPKTCRPISTEGKAAILRRKIVADNFPDWRTNCFLVKIADSAYSPAVFIHPEAALKANFVPGDIIVARRCLRNLSVSCYVNPPSEEFAIEIDAAELEKSSLPYSKVAVPKLLAKQMDVNENDTIILEGPLNPPEAESVTIVCEQSVDATSEELQRSACTLFGLKTSEEESETERLQSLLLGIAMQSDQTATDIEKSAEEGDLDNLLEQTSALQNGSGDMSFSWLGGHLEQRQCRYIPLARGDYVQSEIMTESQNNGTTSVTMKISHTSPLGTVLVGPSSKVNVERSSSS